METPKKIGRKKYDEGGVTDIIAVTGQALQMSDNQKREFKTGGFFLLSKTQLKAEDRY